MSKPPKTPPSSDTEGVDQDWRIGLTSTNDKVDPGRLLSNAEEESTARPEGAPPLGEGRLHHDREESKLSDEDVEAVHKEGPPRNNPAKQSGKD